MKDDVIKRLASFGYTFKQNDDVEDWMLGFIILKVTKHILNTCNILSVPDDLHEVSVDMVVAEFLIEKKVSGQLNELEVLNSEAVTSVKLGDTQVNFSEEPTASAQFDGVMAFLRKGYESDLISHRRIRW